MKTPNESEQTRGARSAAYVVQPHVQSAVVDGEAVIVNLQSNAYFTLSATATVIWEAVQTGEDLERAAARLVEAFDVELTRAREDATAFVDELLRNDLVHVKAA